MTPELPRGCQRQYRPVRMLASGGFGVVWLATHIATGRQAVVKVLHGEVLENAELVTRFRQEAMVSAQVAHPNVVRVLDHDVDDGVPWIAFEFVAGGSLADRLERTGRLPWRSAVACMSDVAAALHHVHQAGILHRDIKPANVMIDADGVHKVTDFGIARWDGRSAVHTRTGVIFGSPTYLAPEIIAGQPPSPASDVYAAGVMLHELVAGVPPFASGNLGQVLDSHVNTPAPDVRARAPDAPAALSKLLERVLAKDPHQRIASARAFGAALAQLAASSEELALPESSPPPRPGVSSGALPPGPTQKVDRNAPRNATKRIKDDPAPGAASRGQNQAPAARPAVTDGPLRTASFAVAVVGALAGLVVGATLYFQRPQSTPATASARPAAAASRAPYSADPSPSTTGGDCDREAIWSGWRCLRAFGLRMIAPLAAASALEPLRLAAEKQKVRLRLGRDVRAWAWWLGTGAWLEGRLRAPDAVFLPPPHVDLSPGEQEPDLGPASLPPDGTREGLMARAIQRVAADQDSGVRWLELATLLEEDGLPDEARLLAGVGLDIVKASPGTKLNHEDWKTIVRWLAKLDRLITDWPAVVSEVRRWGGWAFVDKHARDTGDGELIAKLLEASKKRPGAEQGAVIFEGQRMEFACRPAEARKLFVDALARHPDWLAVSDYLVLHFLERGLPDVACRYKTGSSDIADLRRLVDRGLTGEDANVSGMACAVYGYLLLGSGQEAASLRALERMKLPKKAGEPRKFYLPECLIGRGCSDATVMAWTRNALVEPEIDLQAWGAAYACVSNAKGEALLADLFAECTTGPRKDPNRQALRVLNALHQRRWKDAWTQAKKHARPGLVALTAMIICLADSVSHDVPKDILQEIQHDPPADSGMFLELARPQPYPDLAILRRSTRDTVDAMPHAIVNLYQMVWLARVETDPEERAAWARRARAWARRYSVGAPLVDLLPPDSEVR